MLNEAHKHRWSDFYGSTTKGEVLTQREMALVGLAASMAVDCEPCMAHYVELCRELGVQDAEVNDVLAKVMAVSAGMRNAKLQGVLAAK